VLDDPKITEQNKIISDVHEMEKTPKGRPLKNLIDSSSVSLRSMRQDDKFAGY
jgi:hypothetical protein